MSVESDLYALLSAGSALFALVEDRIYPDCLPEKCSYPALIFSRRSTDPLIGISGNRFGVDVEMTIDCWAETRTVADSVAEAVESTVQFTAFELRGRESAYDPDTGLFASILTVTTFATS